MNNANSSTNETKFQTDRNRIMRAAICVAQGSLLLRQESTDLLGGRDATRLRGISDGLQYLVFALNRLGRAGEIKPSELIPMRLAPPDEPVAAGAAS